MTDPPPEPRPLRWTEAAAVAAVVGLGLWPLRGALAAPGALLGDATDSVHHAWGYWYLAEGSPEVAGWPVGVAGSVVGGPSLVLAWAFTRAWGALPAFAAVSALQVALTLVATAAVARRLTGAPHAGVVAALGLLAGRPLLDQIGLGVTEGAAAGWLIAAFAVGLAAAPSRPRQLAAGLLTGALLGSSVLENPYTLPIVVLAGPLVAIRRARSGQILRLLAEALGGLLVLAVWRALQADGGGLGAASSSLPSFELFGRTFSTEPAEAVARPLSLLAPTPLLPWPGGATRAYVEAGVGNYLGWTTVLLALVALGRPRARTAAAVGLLLAALALGSWPLGQDAGVPGPMLLVNMGLDLVVRPLTQPARYLVLAGSTLGVAIALATAGWPGRWRAAIVAVLVAEALLVGSAARRVPVVPLGGWACAAEAEGPVVVAGAGLPTDAAGALLQLVHEKPATHKAIGGWRLRAERDPALAHALKTVERGRHIPVDVLLRLEAAGVATLLVSEAGGEGIPVSSAERRCGGLRVVPLAGLRRLALPASSARATGAGAAYGPGRGPE